jgi:hypothetical protein
MLVNCTPHAIDVLLWNGDILSIPPSGTVARVATFQQDAGLIDGVPISDQVFGDIVGLPDPSPGTYYIVSALVLNAAKAVGRTDCLAPNTIQAYRDSKGNILGVPGFIR